jgi:hypothetical protein
MRNKIVFLSLILSLFAVNAASASTASKFTINDAPYEEWNNSEFDRLALDVVVPSNNGASDSLQSISVMNLESATPDYGISDLYLWKDEGATGFQGMGIDKKVGRGKWDSENRTWYWTNLGLTVPSTGLRIFVTVETKRTISSRYSVRLDIPQFEDVNKNGTFDAGDKGIFMASGNNAPTDKEVANVSYQLIKSVTVDSKSPKVVVTNLPENYQVAVGSPYLISGLSRDEGFSSVQGVKIYIAKEGGSGVWTDVATDSTNYGRWTYSWTPSSAGKYTVKVKASDFMGNESISSPITVEAVSGLSVASQAKSTFTVDKLTAKADGKIYINTAVEVKDANGNLLAGKAVEVSYLRADDGYIARDTRTTGDNGELVWGIPTITPGTVVLIAIVDGKLMTQSYTISFTE